MTTATTEAPSTTASAVSAATTIAAATTTVAGATTTKAPAATTTKATTTTVAPTTTTKPLTPIKVRFVTGQATSLVNLSHFAALASDQFAKNGIDLTVLPGVSNSTLMVQLVLTGDTDFALIGSSGMLGAVDQGKDVVAIADTCATPPLLLTVTPDREAKLAAKGITAKSPIADRIQALKGLTIGTFSSGTITDVILRSTLATYGLSPNTDVTIRPFADTTTLLAAVKAGQIDIFLNSGPTVGYPILIDYTAGDIPSFSNMAFTTLVTRKSFLASNPEAVRRFLKAEWAGRTALTTDLKSTLAYVKQAYFPETSQSDFDFITTKVLATYKQDLVPTQRSFQLLLQVFNASQDKPLSITFDQAYDPKMAIETKPAGL